LKTMMYALWLCVFYISVCVNGQTQSQCVAASLSLSTCVSTASLTLGAVCDCWNTFQKSYSSCIDSAATLLCTTSIQTVCGEGIVCTFTPATCEEAITSILASTDPCSNFDNFKTFATDLCTSPADALSSLKTCRNFQNTYGCGGECEEDCTALIGNLVTCSDNFSSCTGDKCECFQNFTSCADFTSCSGVNSQIRKSCCEAQFFCSELASNCSSVTNDPISIPDLDDLFINYNNEFIKLWNQALTNVNITIEDCTHITHVNNVVFTVHASFDELTTTVTVVGQHIFEQFSLTIGINGDHISGEIGEGSRKRGLMSYQVTATGQSGSSMISVFILPIILLNGLLYFLFN